jgi:hypothetical protein
MAYTANRPYGNYHALAVGGGGGVVGKTIKKSFTSSVDIVGANGALEAIILSGLETETTDTVYGNSLTDPSGLTIRSKVTMTNEDMAKQETTTLSFT